jgi:hypothetical protein
MLDKTICISVFLGGLGNNRKVRNSEVGIDSDDIHVSKTLLESPEYEAIKRFDRATIKWLNNKCIPSFFRAGIYCVPIPSVQEAEGYMKERFTGRAELVDKLLAVYDVQKAEAETRLGTVQVGSVQVNVYNPLEYPPKSAVQAAYKFEWNWVNLGTPGKLKSISASFFEQEQKKAESKWAEATDQVKTLMRSQFKDLVDHLVERLTPDENGKSKKWHGTTLTKVSEFLEAFSVKNVTDDAELEQLVGATKKLMEGVDVETVKDSDRLRSNIQKGFGIVKGCLDQLVVEGGTRKISFLDEV